jgi:AmiR/NasT family two-component response regulator
MTSKLSIAVADDEARMRDYYCSTLPLLGHRVSVAARNGDEMVAKCRDARPDLIITDIKMPDMDGIDAAREVCRGEPIPVILVSAYHETDLLDRARGENILAYLVKPIKQADLETAISVAMQRFGEFQALRKEAGELRTALEDRKVIERAKGILMKKTGLDEAGAFHRLQKLSRDHNQKMVEVARMLLRAEEAFQAP